MPRGGRGSGADLKQMRQGGNAPGWQHLSVEGFCRGQRGRARAGSAVLQSAPKGASVSAGPGLQAGAPQGWGEWAQDQLEGLLRGAGGMWAPGLAVGRDMASCQAAGSRRLC